MAANEPKGAIFEIGTAVFEALNETVNPVDRPDVLYHFTDVEGLLGIATSNTLRATVTTSLNDATEMLYTINLVRELNQKELDAPGLFRTYLDEYLNFEDAQAQDRIKWHLFVASFCATQKSALHWLHYGRKGTGVAVGLKAKGIEAPSFGLVKVIYDRTQQVAMIQSLVSLAVAKAEELALMTSVNDRPGLYTDAASVAAQALIGLGGRFKPPEFEAEQEWRLISAHLTQGGKTIGAAGAATKVCARGGRLVAYKEASYSPVPIVELVLGAACPTSPDDIAVQTLLPTVPARRSMIRVRP